MNYSNYFSDPYLMSLIPWGSGDIANPKTKPVIVTDAGTNIFNKHATIVGYFSRKVSNGQLWWDDGMQSSVVHVVHILTDNPEEGVYCGFCAMNSQKHFMLLGKLKDGEAFTEQARKVLTSYAA